MRRRDTPLFRLPFLFDSSESLPFGELSLTEGARLVLHERKKNMRKEYVQTHCRRRHTLSDLRQWLKHSLFWRGPRGLTFTWWGWYGLCRRHKPDELAHSFLKNSVLVFTSVFVALSTVLHSINSPYNSPLSHSVLLVLSLPFFVLSAVCPFIKVFFSPDAKPLPSFSRVSCG